MLPIYFGYSDCACIQADVYVPLPMKGLTRVLTPKTPLAVPTPAAYPIQFNMSHHGGWVFVVGEAYTIPDEVEEGNPSSPITVTMPKLPLLGQSVSTSL